MDWSIDLGDVVDCLEAEDDNSFDSILCDPPYGIDFAGHDWDSGVPGESCWEEVKRVVKPGGIMLSFGGRQTEHRLACAMEDAGWRIIDKIMWLYGTGFPAGAYRVQRSLDGEDADRYEGYRTKLKPAWEPVVVAQNPRDGSYANNVDEYDVAGYNIDGGRISTETEYRRENNESIGSVYDGGGSACVTTSHPEGRYPTNVICSEEVRDELEPKAHDDNGDFYFYVPKASKSEREAGLDELGAKDATENFGLFGDKRCKKCGRKKTTGGQECTCDDPDFEDDRKNRERVNHHPTVKPLDLCRYLANLIIPPEREDADRRLLVPFSGSGSEMIGALNAGWDHVHGIEQEHEYNVIARNRIEHWTSEEGG